MSLCFASPHKFTYCSFALLADSAMPLGTIIYIVYCMKISHYVHILIIVHRLIYNHVLLGHIETKIGNCSYVWFAQSSGK